MNPWIALLIGLFLGVNLAVLVMGILVSSRKREPKMVGREDIARMRQFLDRQKET